MRIAHLDCFSGISGDMMLGALVGAGVDLDELAALLEELRLPGWSLRQLPAEREHRVPGTSIEVVCDEGGHAHRTFTDIQRLIAEATLPATVAERATDVFHRLAVAEGKVHGQPPAEVTFHEVGAIDSIVDIVGSVAGFHLLGIDRLSCAPIPLGRGKVRCRHGLIPIPAPATAELLQGVPTYPGEDARELVTPTGAALATSLAGSFGAMPPMEIEAIGYGLGKAAGESMPNALRLFVGTTPTEHGVPQSQSLLLEANIDDLSPQFYGPLVVRLLAAGAQDAYLTAVQMKKGRPGTLVSVLCDPSARDRMEQILFDETTTIGVRRHAVWRSCLERATRTVHTAFGDVRIKESFDRGTLRNRMPEFDDCRRLADQRGVPVRQVHDAALMAAAEDDR